MTATASTPDRHDYDVTDKAGPVVAGRRGPFAAPLSLTDAEAEYELREGTIVRKGKSLAKAFETDRRADRAREEAAQVKAGTAEGAAREATRPAAPAAATAPSAPVADGSSKAV